MSFAASRLSSPHPSQPDPQEGSEDNALLFLTRQNRRLRLKWHRARLREEDRAFDPAVLKAGLTLGAHMEVDLRPLADGDFIVLHDKTLSRETTGRGQVAALTAGEARALRLRGPNGRRLTSSPLLLDDLIRLITRSVGGTARLHLDLKAERSDLTAEHIARFQKAAYPIRHRLEVGGRDWQAVCALCEGLDGIRRGFDPSPSISDQPGLGSDGFRGLLIRLRKATPEADVYYLPHAVITTWLDAGLNAVEVLRETGAEVEAWTIKRSAADLENLIDTLNDAGVTGLITDDALALSKLSVHLPASEQDIPSKLLWGA